MVPPAALHHNQKPLPPLASLILLPAPGEGGMSGQSCGEQNKQRAMQVAGGVEEVQGGGALLFGL